MNLAIANILEADTLIVGGTSLNVYPAAGLIRYFNGKNLIIINKEATSYDELATLVIREPIGKAFKQIKVK
jgi:NAD-dependent deacetylase